jgi:glycogen debranching enzyme
MWRLYMQRHRQNLPWQYHNGGIWPFVGGFWVMALTAAGQRQEALQELEGLAQAAEVNDWQFNEWFNGATGKPEGMPHQTWNAAMFLLAKHSFEHRVFPPFSLDAART